MPYKKESSRSNTTPLMTFNDIFNVRNLSSNANTDGSAIGLDWNAIYRELNTIQLQWNTANTGEVFNEVFSGMNTLQHTVNHFAHRTTSLLTLLLRTIV